MSVIIRIKALEHLIEARFDSDKSCHAVCQLVFELLGQSDDDISRELANIAQKALASSVQMHKLN
ncbi:MAG: hypothetical protein ACI9FJ_000610 [Alteromonadaceae bacterium]|jgi:hypothetical protein